MKVKVENMRHWVDDTFQIVVHTNNAEEFVSWLETTCPHHSKLRIHTTNVPGLRMGWQVVSFTLIEDRDVMMFKLTWK